MHHNLPIQLPHLYHLLRSETEPAKDEFGFGKGIESVGFVGALVRDVEVISNRSGVLVALLLRRQRERRGLTLAEAAQRLGQRSRNAYARYEQGATMPTIEKLEQLLEAIAPDQTIVWRIVV